MFSAIGKAIATPRFRLLFLFSLILPFFSGGFYLYQKKLESDLFEERFWSASQKGKRALQRKKTKETFFTTYAHSASDFLSEQLEKRTFLNEEKKAIEKILLHPALIERNAFEKRAAFLNSKENRLLFLESAIRSRRNIQEVEEVQQRSVEMSSQDLKELLSLIEEVPIDSFEIQLEKPQTLITYFSLEKKFSPIDTPCFSVSMNLLTREVKP